VTFWSSQTLERRIAELIDPADHPIVDCNALELKVGPEVYVTPNLQDAATHTKRLLSANEPFQIPPGQFAFLLTEEVVSVPPDAMAFISMKATFKMKGLVNVSGFHVDPGWRGQLIFAVFNAGPSPIHLQRGLSLFLIWYASLDYESAHRKTKSGPTTIPPSIINNLSGASDSLYELDQRLKTEIQDLEEQDEKLNERIHAVEKSQTRVIVYATILLTILVGLVGIALRAAIMSFITSVAPATLPAAGATSSAPPQDVPAASVPSSGSLPPNGNSKS
jgi:dCTP deaminase